ncbi:MAG TPA: FecR domain-containing protein [Bacteroidales bacterium]|nr:FecR domain-containing protein [Bacteroidales bacterium]
MKTDPINPNVAEALARYLGGEMSQAECEAFLDENAVTEVEKQSIEHMKKQWTAMKNYQEHKIPDTGKAWDKLHARLENDNLIPSATETPVRRLMPALLKIAAVLIIVIGIGAVIYTSGTKNPSSEMVQLNTANDANTLIKTLADGSVIYIAQNSEFSFPKEFESMSRNVALNGEAFFDIAPNPLKPFIIETDEATIEVLGTAFNVKDKQSNGFELCVDRGKVKVTLKKDPTHPQLVVAGEKVNSSNNNLVKSKYVANSQSAWYKQRMHFKDEKLQNIVSVLNRNFNTSFVIPEAETRNREITVTFNRETEETMTELICLTLNLKSQKINGSVVLSENKKNATQN